MENLKFDIKAQKGFDKELNKEYLAIQNTTTNHITKHYYEKIDRIILENMPDDILLDLYYKIKEEKLKRILI